MNQYNDQGFDENGYDKEGYNAWGEMDPAKAGFQQEYQDIRNVCQTRSGRDFVWRILSFCKVFEDFETIQSDKDNNQQIGQRRVGLHIMSILTEADQTIFATMMSENYQRQKEKEDAKRKYAK